MNKLYVKGVQKWKKFHLMRTKSILADDLVLFTNTPAQTEYLRHSLEQAAGGVGLHVNANKTEFMCFKQEGAISTLSGKPLK